LANEIGKSNHISNIVSVVLLLFLAIGGWYVSSVEKKVDEANKEITTIDRMIIGHKVDGHPLKVIEMVNEVNKKLIKHEENFNEIDKWRSENDRVIENRDTVQCMYIHELQGVINSFSVLLKNRIIYENKIECGAGAGGF